MFIVAVAVATLVPISLAISGLGTPKEETTFGFYNNQESAVQDPSGDAQPVLQYSNTAIVPETKSYHDILGASVKKQGTSFLFSIKLAGDPNMNVKYETNYMWHLLFPDPSTGKDQQYVVMFIDFGPEFNITSTGWHYAVFDNTRQVYVVPQTKIADMPSDRVEGSIEDWMMGNPSSFRYWVSTYVRVNSTSFEGPPEYLMDYAP